jgi:aspartate kinase
VLGGFIGRHRPARRRRSGRAVRLLGRARRRGIDAEEIQIWTDVDGMLTADPRIVHDAELVPHLSFAEAAELAYFGAKVLHPSTIFPAVSRNIPVRILNSHRPEAPGTLITADPAVGEAVVRRARVQARHHDSRHHVDAHADGARLPAARLRGVRIATRRPWTSSRRRK